MANRYAPLQLPANPRAMPQDYQTKISYFDSTGFDSARQHTKKIQDYFENSEIDDDGVRMKIFVQSLTGDVRTWFRSLQANSIGDPEALYQTFITRWEKKKDPLHILSEYNTIKRGPQETVLEYCARFNNIYNAIPQNLRPPPDLALYTFPDGFDADMAYQLRERAPQTLAEMQNVAVSVEANLIAKRNRARAERKTTFKEEPSSWDQKLDAIINGMQRLGERVESVERKSSWEGPQNNPIRNPNFRRNQNQNTGKASPENQIRPPFQENYTETSTANEQKDDTHINLMGLNNEQQVFLSQEDQEEDEVKQFQTKSGESFDFKQGYDTAVFEVRKQYKLRSRTINVSQPEKTKDDQKSKKATISESKDKSDPITNEVTVEDITETYASNQQPSPTLPLHANPNNPPQKMRKKDKPLDQTEKQEEPSKRSIDKEKVVSQNTKLQIEKPFDFESEIGKLKISIPLSELAKHDTYKQQIIKSLQLNHNKDDVNIMDDTPELLFGPEVDGKTASAGVYLFTSACISMIRYYTMQCLIPRPPITSCPNL